MITGVELRNIAEQGYNDGVGGYDPWYDAIAAVVRALEPVIEQSFKLGAQYVSNHVPDYGANDCAKDLVRKILVPDAVQNLRETYVRESPFGKYMHKAAYGDQLKEILTGITDMHLGDAPTGDDGVSEESTETTSPASFCEWRSVDGEWSRQCSLPALWPDFKSTYESGVCPSCGKTIKFAEDDETISFCEWRLTNNRGALGFRWVEETQCGADPTHEGYAEMWGGKCLCGKPIKFAEDNETISFCEWRYDEDASSFDTACGNKWCSVFSRDPHEENYYYCPSCGRPTRAMADASYRKNEGTLLVDAGGVNPSAPSAVTIEETLNILYGNGWKHNISADVITDLLLSAGYKILSREPSLEMIAACADWESWKITFAENWRVMWDAAK